MKTPKSCKFGWVLVAVLAVALMLPGTASAFGSGQGDMWGMLLNGANTVEEDAESNPGNPESSPETNPVNNPDSEPRAVPAPGAAPLMALGLAGFWAVSYVGRRSRTKR